MWLDKWFGRKQAEDAEDEPARFVAPDLRRSPPSSVTPPSTTTSRKQDATSAKGFDPYNSGAFERRKAWERINRR